jgi:hypothetical protein
LRDVEQHLHRHAQHVPVAAQVHLLLVRHAHMAHDAQQQRSQRTL